MHDRTIGKQIHGSTVVPKDRLLIAILGIANSNIIGPRFSCDDRSVTPLFRSFEERKFCNSDATFSTTVPTSNYGPSATFGSSKDKTEVVHIVSLYSTLFYAITGNYHSTRDPPLGLYFAICDHEDKTKITGQRYSQRSLISWFIPGFFQISEVRVATLRDSKPLPTN
jgi:hypothetical protein